LDSLKQAIIEKLQTVIDPETGADVWRMRLVKDLQVDEGGFVRYTFQPSSPFCPLAITLAQNIKNATSLVPGVTGQKITVVDYVQAPLLTELLN
jgi:metal-sulfur cluster biosynthetic enzyme